MIQIALDGLSGSGKGELARGLAKKLNLKHLDTGAIFRGIACAFSKLGYTNPTEAEINENIDNIKIDVVFDGNTQIINLDGENINSKLRTEEISQLSSKVSAYSSVREKYLKIVRDFAQKNDCIIDGRDIGSIVLPDADVKFYLTASEEIRARRRYEENVTKQIPCTYEEVLKGLKERDERDTTRKIGPLVKVADAVEVDNSNMNIEQTIEYCYKICLEKIATR